MTKTSTPDWLAGKIDFLDKNGNCIYEYRSRLELISIAGAGTISETADDTQLELLADSLKSKAAEEGVRLIDEPYEYLQELYSSFDT